MSLLSERRFCVFSQLAGFILGFTPYLIAEVVLRVVRARR
jgi:hypothetical protein